MTETRSITEDEARDFMFGDVDPDEWVQVQDEIVDVSRWHVHHVVVYRSVKDGTFWEYCYSRGATEYQDHQELDLFITRYHRVPRQRGIHTQ